MARSGTSPIVSALARLSPRERVLLGVMGIVALTMICLIAVLMTNRSLNRLERSVEERQEALRDLRERAPELAERLADRNASKNQPTAEPPPIGGRLEKHATEAEIDRTALEMVDQPAEEQGGWLRKSVQLRVRRQPLGKLADFWARIVSDRADYPVAITKLNVRRRRHEEDSYDVEMIVATYTPSEEEEESETGSKRGGKRAKSATKTKGRS